MLDSYPKIKNKMFTKFDFKNQYENVKLNEVNKNVLKVFIQEYQIIFNIIM